MRSLNKRSILAGAGYAIRWGSQAAPGAMVLTVFLTLLTAAAPPLQLWLVRVIVNEAVAGVALWTAAGLSLMLGVTFGVTAALNTFRNVGGVRLSSAISISVQRRYLERLQLQPAASMENAEERDRLAIIWETASSKVNSFLDQGTVWIAFLLSSLGVIGVLFTIQPIIALLVLSSAFLPIFVTALLFGVWDKVQTRNAPLGRISAVLAQFLVSPSGFLDGRLSGSGTATSRNYVSLLQRQARHQIWGTDREALYSLVSALWTALTLGAAVTILLSEGGSAGEIAASLTAITEVGLLSNLTFMAGSLVQMTPYLAELGDYLEEETPSAAGTKTIDRSRQASATTVSIAPSGAVAPSEAAQPLELHDVAFTYPGSETGIHDITLRIEPGKILALVGPNGAGKSTLLKVLARAYAPKSGSMMRGEEVIARPAATGDSGSAFVGDTVARWCAVQLQDQPRPPVTLREYVTAGREGIADETIISVLEQAGVPATYRERLDHLIGQEFEDGLAFSGGQWQMVGLARVLLSPAPLWLLDEPSSALDPDGERRLLDRVRQAMEGRCVVMVSHRLSTVLKADAIAVVRDGTIVETGKPWELLDNRDSAFRELFAPQLTHDEIPSE